MKVQFMAQRPHKWPNGPKQPTAHATKKLSVLAWAQLLLLELRIRIKEEQKTRM